MIKDGRASIVAIASVICVIVGCRAVTATDVAHCSEVSEVQKNTLDMEFVWVPADKFVMGSSLSPSEIEKGYGGVIDAFSNEFPKHQVALSKGFWISRFETTQSQYESIMGDNPSALKAKGSGAHPVDTITWKKAVEFCEKLSEREGKKYTLPSEAQWEYACRAGTATAYFFGNDANDLNKYAWYDTENRIEIKGSTHPVGQKLPNPWGLYDVYGNVSEWCLDYYDPNSYSSASKIDPVNNIPKEADSRLHKKVHRGGSWVHPDEHCRSASRDFDFINFNFADNSRGFRVICWDLCSDAVEGN